MTKSSLFLDSDVAVKGMLQDLGRSPTTVGHWKHDVMVWMVQGMMAIMCDCMMVKMGRGQT
jgi:hypothetical protein